MTTLTPSPTIAAHRRIGQRAAARRPGLPRPRGASPAPWSPPRLGGSVLVIDQDAESLTDRRLIAPAFHRHEPAVNARVVAELYPSPTMRAAARGRWRRTRDWATLPASETPTSQSRRRPASCATPAAPGGDGRARPRTPDALGPPRPPSR